MATDQHIIESLGRIEKRLESLEKRLVGNGGPGYSERLRKVESAVRVVWGVCIAFGAIGVAAIGPHLWALIGGWLTTGRL